MINTSRSNISRKFTGQDISPLSKCVLALGIFHSWVKLLGLLFQMCALVFDMRFLKIYLDIWNLLTKDVSCRYH